MLTEEEKEARQIAMEDQAIKDARLAKHWSRITTGMVFVAFMGWLISSVIISNNQVSAVMGNRAALECIIQQISEHRINNRTAHSADGNHHGYRYEIEEDNIPSTATYLDVRVCDKWINIVPLETTPPTTGRDR